MAFSVNRVRELQEEIKTLKENAGAPKKAEKQSNDEGADLTSIMAEEQEKQLRYLRASLSQLQHSTSLFGHYFSYLSFAQVSSDELFDELETIRDASKGELIKKYDTYSIKTIEE